ncbi:MAG: diaminopimelate epimerase [Phycisphaerales bacterium]
MRFVKMHGIGNDYVYVNAFEERVDDPAGVARVVSDRHTGIGSDGLILVAPPTDRGAADVRMRMFNADGSESEMCGNGVRCVTKFAVDRGIASRNPLRVETGRGVLSIRWQRGDDDRVAAATVDMGPPILDAARIPVAIPGVPASSRVVAQPVDESFLGATRGESWPRDADVAMHITCVSMGNPHVVLWCRDVRAIPLERIGPTIENHAWFPKRINVHFVEVVSAREVVMRTWERGSGITLACGTGASAVCVAGVLCRMTGGDLLAHLPGGDLRLEWRGDGASVLMTGPATEVFEGTLHPSMLPAPAGAAR